MWIYLLKSGLCLLVLFSFYKLFLENEQFHRIKRAYLLTAVILAFSLPFVTITYGVEVIEPVSDYTTNTFTENSTSETSTVKWQENIVYAALGIYLMGFMFFGLRFYKNLKSLLKEVKRNEHLKDLNYIFVLMGKRLDPHSFFNYIFLNKTEFQNDRISKAVIEHEKAHVDQKHSFDLVFIEILQVIFWFNPVFYWIKKSIRLNHEFLADKEVLSRDISAFEYTNILFNYSSGYHHNSLTSPINHSLIKKRIIMITKDFSFKKLLTRLGLFVPVLACCIFFFNNNIVAKPVYKLAETNITAETISMPAVEAKSLSSNSNTESTLQQPELKIRIEGEKLWVNGKETKIKNFAKEVDEFTSDFSEAELKDLSIHMRNIDSNESFMKDLDREFAKTRLSKVTGRSILPPPPPMPPSAQQVPPPPPPAPVLEHNSQMANGHRERAREWKHMKDAERKIITEERKRIREIERELQEDKKLTQAERAKMQDKVRKKQAEVNRKMKEVERKRSKIEREHMALEREQLHPEPPKPPSPPPAPDPLESIDEIEKEGGTFYYNGEKISAEEARRIVKEKKFSKMQIHQTDGQDGKFEIFSK